MPILKCMMRSLLNMHSGTSDNGQLLWQPVIKILQCYHGYGRIKRDMRCKSSCYAYLHGVSWVKNKRWRLSAQLIDECGEASVEQRQRRHL